MPQNLSLRDFILTGKLGSLCVGMTQENVRSVMGEPHDTESTSRKYKRPIFWVYGDLEIYFNREDWTVTGLLFNTHTKSPVPTLSHKDFPLDPWIFRVGITWEEVKEGLERENISYQEHPLIENNYTLSTGITYTYDDWGYGHIGYSMHAVRR
jgi:hypothetical protein